MLQGGLVPLDLFEVGRRDESPFRPPPDAPKAWRVHRVDERFVPVRSVKFALPAELDAFIGRDADHQELAVTYPDSSDHGLR